MRFPATAAGAGLVALSAFGGAIGLATGGLALERTLDRRLPFDSPVVGGIALAMLVGLPFAALARLAWNNDRSAGHVAVACGLGLIAWIAVELAFLGEVSFLHPFFVAVGLAFVVAGRRRG